MLASTALPAQEGGFSVGEPLGTTNAEGERTPISDNVNVVGSFRFAESCTFDPQRNLVLAMNAGTTDDMEVNDGFVSLIHPDGSVHTSKWIGASREGLTLNRPLGSVIGDGVLYVADVDTVRSFDLETGRPLDSVHVEGATGLNGIGVSDDGTVYASNTRSPQAIFRITPAGDTSVFAEGEPLMAPNGVEVDNDGNIVVVNVGNNAVLSFNPEGELVRTEHAVDGGNDGLVITADGTKYVSSVRFGSISRIRPGEDAEVIASGIPSAASMCYDSNQNQLVVPMNDNNALAFIPLD